MYVILYINHKEKKQYIIQSKRILLGINRKLYNIGAVTKD